MRVVKSSSLQVRHRRSVAANWPFGRVYLQVDTSAEPVAGSVELTPNQARRLVFALEEGIRRAEAKE